MVRLKRSERADVWSDMMNGIVQNQTMMDEGLCAYASSQMSPKEILMRKYRIIKCIKCLGRMGRIDLVKDIRLPEIGDTILYMEFPSDELEYDDVWQTSLMEVQATLNEFGEQYLTQCLQDTGWKVTYIAALESYEDLGEAVIKKCRDSIDFHWNALNELTDDECHSEYLTALGCRAAGYYSFYPDCNVVLTNENIRQMLLVCGKNPCLQKWEEYKEFRKFWDFSLFDRFFPDISNPDFGDSEWVCLNYMLGEITHERIEETGFYQLNYETVICLMLADMVAEEFMERYHAEKEGSVRIDGRRAS